MARNLNNPEAPREGVEETRRDLNELKSKVTESKQSKERETTALDTTEQLENDPEVKSGFEKILNKGFEKVTWDFEKELPNDFTVDSYMKTIAEKHPDLWWLIAWDLWLPAWVFFWAKREKDITFNQLKLNQKVNFIALKRAIDKLTSWNKELSKISYESIVDEIEKQSELLAKESDKNFAWQWIWEIGKLLTRSEYTKIEEILREKWVTREVADPEWNKYRHWPEPISGTIVLIGWGITVIASAAAWYFVAKRRYNKKPSTPNHKKETYTSTTIEYNENIMRYMTHQAHGSTNVCYEEKAFKGDTKLEALKNAVWTTNVKINVSADVTTSFQWKSEAKLDTRTWVLTINVDRPTVFARNVEWVVLEKGWSRVTLYPNRQVEMHGLKMWEYGLLKEYIWYVYNENTNQWVEDPDRVAKYEKNVKRSLEEWILKNQTPFLKPPYLHGTIKRVVVNFNKWTETQIEIESKHRKDNDNVKVWLRDRDRPRANEPHYKTK